MFKKKITQYGTVLVFIVLTVIVLASTYMIKAASGEVSPVLSKETIKPGDSFDISINVKGIQDIHAASIEFNFDNSLIEVEDIIPGSLFAGMVEDNNFKYFSSVENAASGKVSAATTLLGIDNGISEDGSLFIIKAKALKPGITTLKPQSNYILKLADSSKSFDNKITSFNSKETVINISTNEEIMVKEKLEQLSPKISYSGIWYNHWDPRNSESSAKFTNDKSASFSFSFEGTGFRWYGLGNKFKGKAKVTVDGKTETIDTYSSSEQYQKLFLEEKDLENKKHNVRVEVSTNYINIDFIEILTAGGVSPSTPKPTPIPSSTPAVTPSPAPPKTTVPTATPKPAPANNTIITVKKLEQTDRSIIYSGKWLNHWDNRNSAGSSRYTNDKGATLQFSFQGAGFRWYGLANKFKGKAYITIDGKTETVNTYSPVEQYGKMFYSKQGLTNSSHSVKIETFTEYINVDYFEIIQESVTSVNPTKPSSNSLTGKWTSFEEDNSLIKYYGTWLSHDYSSNSGGSAKFANSTNASVELSFTGTGFRWYGNANKFKGPVIVTVDGKSERVNTYYNGQQYQKLFYEKKGLNFGTHKVKLTVVFDYISIDKFEIENGKLN